MNIAGMKRSDDRFTAIIEDPCTPFWVKNLVADALRKDPVDIINWLTAIEQEFSIRATQMRTENGI